jgi:hypothetical protein
MTNAWIPPVQNGYDDASLRLSFASLSSHLKGKYAGLVDDNTFSGTLNVTGILQKGGVAGKILVMSGTALLAADYTGTAARVNLTGLTTGSLSLLAGDVVLLQGTWDMRSTNAASTGVGQFWDGAAVVGAAGVLSGAVGTRVVSASSTVIPIVSSGSKTYTSTAICTGTAGTVFGNTQTSFSWQVFR